MSRGKREGEDELHGFLHLMAEVPLRLKEEAMARNGDAHFTPRDKCNLGTLQDPLRQAEVSNSVWLPNQEGRDELRVAGLFTISSGRIYSPLHLLLQPQP
ncbi:hypothetical protein llap_15393 [Limosa lapponica baueri]|uniref:Uncharacterized protein n=1 Tax=Limosa lapponica baueri TaxID=1758121 RepID=A0A2I0TKQ0_LIMLA|nr:hypothetical protein llap_15393 [Limosa lapponica baueri]